MRKYIFFFLFSLFVGISTTILCAEIVFFITHRGWYKDLSLHVRRKELNNVIKDKSLISNYNHNLLHRPPDKDSALREYVELINFSKPADVYRILCIGGSTTRGVGLQTHQSYPYLLQQIFDQQYPGKVEVLNLGLHGRLTKHFIEYFWKASPDADFGWKDLKPDLVILAPVWNDIADDLILDVPIMGSLKWRNFLIFLERNFSSRCALGFYIYKGSRIMYERAKTKHCSRDLNFFMQELEASKAKLHNNITRIIDLWREEGVKVYLLIFPCLIKKEWSDELLRSLLKKNYSKSVFFEHRLYPIIHKADQEIITSIAKEYNIKCFDFSDTLDSFPVEAKVQLFADAVHVGPTINLWMAQGLSGSIIAQLNGVSD